MTRINATLNPNVLADQHLLAEYTEFGLFYASLRRSLQSKTGIDLRKIPKKFTLNSGHVCFFYNKLNFIQNRYEDLKTELQNRKFKLDETRKLYETNEFPKYLYNDWDGDETSSDIIKERIRLRLRQKPKFYRYYGQKIDVEEFIGRYY